MNESIFDRIEFTFYREGILPRVSIMRPRNAKKYVLTKADRKRLEIANEANYKICARKENFQTIEEIFVWLNTNYPFKKRL